MAHEYLVRASRKGARTQRSIFRTSSRMDCRKPANLDRHVSLPKHKPLLQSCHQSALLGTPDRPLDLLATSTLSNKSRSCRCVPAGQRIKSLRHIAKSVQASVALRSLVGELKRMRSLAQTTVALQLAHTRARGLRVPRRHLTWLTRRLHDPQMQSAAQAPKRPPGAVSSSRQEMVK
jgi:hypothetical protein